MLIHRVNSLARLAKHWVAGLDLAFGRGLSEFTTPNRTVSLMASLFVMVVVVDVRGVDRVGLRVLIGACLTRM